MAEPREIYVYGSGGHGKVVATVLRASRMNLAGFLDDDPSSMGKRLLDLPTVGGVKQLEALLHAGKPLGVIVGIGNNAARRDVFARLADLGIARVSAVHPSVIVHESVKIGAGTVAMAGVIVNVDTRIGQNVILNTGALIDHDCVIEDHVHLAPGVVLAGGVRVREGAFLGAGVSVVPGMTIGAYAVVGAGAAVIRDVSPEETVAGVPAKPL